MDKLYIKLVAVALLVTLLGGCSKILDVKPKDKLDEEDNYLVRSSLRHTLFQFPSLLRSAVAQSLIYSDLRGELLTVNSNASPDLQEIENQNISLSNTYIDPKPFYRIIINANDVLSKFRQAAKVDPSISTSDTISVLYESISARAWAYLQLSYIYKKVPFFTTNQRSATGFAYTMLTRAQIADSMVHDFSRFDNKDLLGYGYSFDNTDSYFNRIRFSTYGCLLMKGVWCIEQHNYPDALNALYWLLANQVEGAQQATKFRMIAMTGVGYSPYSNSSYGDRFIPGRIDAKDYACSQDYVICTYYNQNNGEENSLHGLFYPQALSSYSGCTYQLKPSSFAVANWKAQIKLLTVSGQVTQVPGDYRGLKGSYDTIPGSSGGQYYVNKYRNQYDQIIMYRAADINFYWAEARTLFGYPTDGLNIINPQDLTKGQHTPFLGQIGVRAYMSLDSVIKKPNTIFPDTLTGVRKVMLAILDERGLELAYEGKRWFDLVRIAEDLNDPSILADRVARKFTDSGKAAAIRQKLMDPNNWYLKFPTDKLPTPSDTIQTQ